MKIFEIDNHFLEKYMTNLFVNRIFVKAFIDNFDYYLIIFDIF